jgi:hypothetical protein
MQMPILRMGLVEMVALQPEEASTQSEAAEAVVML